MAKSKATSRPRVLLVNRCFAVNDQKQILFIQRSATDSHYAGLWEIPGGKLDEGQDLSNALEREVLEETNLLIEPTLRLVFADSQILAKGPYAGLPYIVLFSIGKAYGGTLKLSSEHDDAQWLNYDDAQNRKLTPEVRKALLTLASHLT